MKQPSMSMELFLRDRILIANAIWDEIEITRDKLDLEYDYDEEDRAQMRARLTQYTELLERFGS